MLNLSLLYQSKTIILLTTKRFFTEKYPLYVSALAFSTLLSIVPFLSVSVFSLSFSPLFSNYIIFSNNYILQNLIPAKAGTIQTYLQNFVEQAARLPVISILFLGLTAILMINTIDEVINNNIWEIKENRKKHIIWLFYIITLLLAPFLLGISVFFTTYLISHYFLSTLTSFMFLILPLVINTIILTLFYTYAPSQTVRKRNGFLAGFVAALLIEVAKILFAMWMAYFSNYELIYGVFAIFPIFLVWLYIFWFIIVWGAILTHTLSHQNLIFNLT